MGHIARVCKAKLRAREEQSKTPKQSHYIEDSEDAYGELNTIRDPKCAPITAEITVNGIALKFEVDTGASTTVITQSTFHHLHEKSGATLEPSDLKLRTYTGQTIPIIGCAALQARYDTRQLIDVVAQVVTGDGPNLLGRDWLQKLEVDLGTIQAVQPDNIDNLAPLEETLQKYSEVCTDKLGCSSERTLHFLVLRPGYFLYQSPLEAVVFAIDLLGCHVLLSSRLSTMSEATARALSNNRKKRGVVRASITHQRHGLANIEGQDSPDPVEI